MEWCHKKGSLPHKKFKTQLSANNILASVFWNSEGMIHVDFLSHGITIIAPYYSNSLCNDVHQEILNKKIWETVKDHHPTASQHLITYGKFD
jgi:hypothetical protein